MSSPMSVLMRSLFLLVPMCILQLPLNAQNISIQGVVTRSDSVEPLPKATVELRRDAPDGVILMDMTTEDDGRFFFPNVQPGRYRLTLKRAGYTRQPVPITVSDAEPVINVRLAMIPTGAIYGSVYDSNGEAAANILVQALKASYPAGRRVLEVVQSVRTNDIGEYRLFWLPPGRYYVRALPRTVEAMNIGMFGVVGVGINARVGGNRFSFFSSGTADPAVENSRAREMSGQVEGSIEQDRHVAAYFSGTTDEEAATAIDVRAGADLGGVNLIIAPVQDRRVRGIVLNGATVKAPEYATLSAGDTMARLIGPPDTPQVDPASGTFDITLPPGRHTLTAHSSDGNGSVTIHVAGADLDGVTIRTTPRFSLAGRITVDGAAVRPSDLGALRISLLPDSDPRPSPASAGYSTPLANGTFTLEAAAGDFRVNIAPLLNLTPPPPMLKVPQALQSAYVKSIRLGNTDILNGGLHLEKASDAPLEIVLGTDAGIVEGVVTGEQTGNEISVVLLPSIRSRMDLYRSAVTDPNGRFRFVRVPPGDYKLFAWIAVHDGAWYDPEFVREFENRGTAVRVREGATAQVRIEPVP